MRVRVSMCTCGCARGGGTCDLHPGKGDPDQEEVSWDEGLDFFVWAPE
jgi:hypothetical protein